MGKIGIIFWVGWGFD